MRDLRQFEAEMGVQAQRIVLGDALDAGPKPAETLKKLRALSQVHIRGNHEDYLHECVSGINRERYESKQWAIVPWTVEQLGRERFLEYEKELTFSHVEQQAGILFLHADLRANGRTPSFIDWASSQMDADLKFAAKSSQLIVSGHTHLAGFYANPHPGKSHCWLNAGSVGYPFLRKSQEDRDNPMVTYALICSTPEGKKFSFKGIVRRVSVDRERLRRDWLQSGLFDLCPTYARAIALQSFLNESIVFHALMELRRKNRAPSFLYQGLSDHMARYQLDKTFAEIFPETV